MKNNSRKIKSATIFPRLGLNIRPNAGDILVWQNIEVDAKNDLMSLHAACPIWDGVKIGKEKLAILKKFRCNFVGEVLRSGVPKLASYLISKLIVTLVPCPKNKKWSLDVFLKPKSTYRDNALFCKGPGPE